MGEAPSSETLEQIEKMIAQYPEALGTHDVMVHQYGAGVTIASLHVEVDGAGDIFALHDIMDMIEKRLMEEHQILCTIHMDPIVTNDAQVNALREKTAAAVREIDERYQIHDFRFVKGPTHTNLIFDVAIPFEVKTPPAEIRRKIEQKISSFEGNYYAVITIDRA